MNAPSRRGIVVIALSVAPLLGMLDSSPALGGDAKTRVQGESRQFTGMKTAVTCVAIAGDGKTVLGGAKDGTVCLWNAESGQELHRLSGPSGELSSAAFSADGRRVAAGCKDGGVFVWDSDTGHQRPQLAGHRDAVLGLTFLPDGKRLMSGAGGVDHSMRLWDTERGKQASQSAFSKKGIIYALAFAPDGRWALTGHASDVKFWDAAGKEVANLDGHTARVYAVAVARDGRIGASAGKDKSIRLWDLSRKKALRVLEGHKDAVNCIAFSTDGKLLASGSGDKTVRLWDVATGKALHVLEGHTNDVTDVAFSADGKKLVSGSADKTVRLWGVPK